MLVALLALSLGGAPARGEMGPRLSVEPPTFDFGRALQQRVLKKRFQLRNYGDRELVIDALQTDCGCTAALLAEQDRTLTPGAAATLEVSLETRASVGRVVRHVLILSNDPERKTFELTLAADVEPAPRKTRR